MNNTKTFAKIILAAIGIYFLIQLIFQSFYPIAIQVTSFSRESFWLMCGSIFISAIAILLVWYFFFYLRDWLAEKIVGTSTGYEPHEQINWFPLAMRLSCVFAGLYCLYNAMWKLMRIIHLLRLYVGRENSFMTNQSGLAEIINFSLFLAVGVYFLCGAPHFVRWQVRKTLEQCKTMEESA